MRSLSSLVVPLLTLGLGLGACGDGEESHTDVEPTLEFATLSDAEIGRLISAAGGGDMFSAQAQVDQFGDTFMADPCPNIAVEGSSATVTGGCTTLDGLEISGSAV